MSRGEHPNVHRRRDLILWLGMVGPAAVWLIYLEVAYLLIHFAGKTGNQTPLHVCSVMFLLTSIVLGILVWLQRPRSSEPANDMADPIINRIRLMVIVGILSSIEFTLIIAGSWIAIFMLNPYQS